MEYSVIDRCTALIDAEVEEVIERVEARGRDVGVCRRRLGAVRHPHAWRMKPSSNPLSDALLIVVAPAGEIVPAPVTTRPPVMASTKPAVDVTSVRLPADAASSAFAALAACNVFEAGASWRPS